MANGAPNKNPYGPPRPASSRAPSAAPSNPAPGATRPRGPPGPRGTPGPGGRPQPRGKRPNPDARAGKSRPSSGKPNPQTPAKRKAKKSRKPRRKNGDATIAEDIIDIAYLDDAEGKGEKTYADDDPFAPVKEPEIVAPAGLNSAHAEHMELTDSSELIATPAVWLLVFLDGLIFLAAFVLGAVAYSQSALRLEFGMAGAFAVLAGVAILVSIIQGRRRFKRACEECVFDVKRSLSPERVSYGEIVTATLDATGCEFPAGLRVSIRDRPSPGFETGRKVLIHEPETVTYQAKAMRRGVQPLSTIDVLMKDPGGLWRHTRSYDVPIHAEVTPGIAALTLRNMLNSRTAFPDGAPKALVNLFRDIEHEQVRHYQGGDRMKDVDWKRMSATGQMLVKDRIIESLDVGLLLIDAGTSMRLVHGGKRNLDHALEGASEIIQEGSRRNHQIGFLAFDDERVVVEMPPTRARLMPHTAQQLFQEVAARHADKAQKPPEPIAVSLQRALRRMVGSNMGVLLFSDLETLDEGIIQLMARLGGDGAKVGVLVLPQVPVEAKRAAFRRDGIRPSSGNYRGASHRRELREVLTIQGIETMDLPI